MSDQRQLPEQVVQRVLDVLPGAEVTAQVDRHRLALTRFATSVIHQNVEDDTTGVRLVVHHDGRTASGSATVSSPDDVAGLVERVREAVRVAPRDPTWPGLTPASAGRPRPVGVDLATAGATPQDRAEVVRGFVEGAGGLETAGYVRTVHRTGGLASSGGRVVVGESTECGLSAIARHDDAGTRWDGLARLAPLSLAELDGELLGARAAAKARAMSGAEELPAGRYEVVLEPGAVFDLLGNLAAHGYGGRAVEEGRSFVRLGEQQLDPAVDLVDDPSEVGVTYDDEGTPARLLPLVEAGRSVGVATDRRTALALSGDADTSTGHSAHGGFSWGPVPLYLALRPSGGPEEAATEVDGPAADSSVTDLVAGVERGILVSDFWYTRMLDPRSVSFTGLTRNGTWLVEDGRITRPVSNLRFTQSYVDALAPGQVRGVGRTATPVPGDTYSASSPRFSCPALHLASWNFTGGASG